MENNKKSVTYVPVLKCYPCLLLHTRLPFTPSPYGRGGANSFTLMGVRAE